MEKMPEQFTAIMKRVRRKDQRYFKRNPTTLEYTRPAIWGEFWPFDVPAGTQVRVYKLDVDVTMRHADIDNPEPMAGYEKEARDLHERTTLQAHEVDEFARQVRDQFASLDEEDIDIDDTRAN